MQRADQCSFAGINMDDVERLFAELTETDSVVERHIEKLIPQRDALADQLADLEAHISDFQLLSDVLKRITK
jgi:hemoglobin-like flavoprotein